ncbi:MAG: prephenate dehydratase [Terriglobales bacterium]
MAPASRRPAITVAIQGEKGSFSEAAVHRVLGRSAVQLLCCASFADVFTALRRGTAQTAVIPIENTLAGSVAANYDLLRREAVTIVAETNLRIRHQLIAPPGVSARAIRRVLSHPVALDQCRRFLSRHTRWEAVPFYDTAGSVQYILEQGLRDAAAIAGEPAAKAYGARILAANIEDNPRNFTRFLRLLPAAAAQRRGLPPTPAPRAGAYKVSVVFATRNQPGALCRALSVFAVRGIDLSRIESRPTPGRPWEYSFYLDFFGSLARPAVRRALQDLAAVSDEVKVLGSYPAVRKGPPRGRARLIH